MTLSVIAPGPLATVQDLGREGRASLGIARSGALDRGALRLGNRLVGNAEGAAGIEITLGGFRASNDADGWIALTGARGIARLDGREIDHGVAAAWPAGTVLELDTFSVGVRGYLAVRGGIDVALSAGARATDLLAGLGPARLSVGSRLPVGAAAAAPVPAIDLAPWPEPATRVDIELAEGPRGGWFAASASRLLYEAEWAVTGDSDRVGMRLDGPVLERVHHGELPSEGMVPGALQVPPNGRPTILLADGPVTGGYPVIAVLTDASLDRLAQLRPGDTLRFRHARPVG